MILLAAASVSTHAVAGRDGRSWFANGRTHYAAGEYAQAVTAFEEAVAVNPGVSAYHHWLGKAYGRLAERAVWLRAMGLARKTRAAFERAVELDQTNLEALSDLEKYYRSAPAFLGGDVDKARQVRRKLARLEDG